MNQAEWERTRKDEMATLDRFLHAMRRELANNADKGDRPGWLASTPEQLLAEVHDHAAKLHVAGRELAQVDRGFSQRPTPWGTDSVDQVDARAKLAIRTLEFAADTANMAMMVADRLALLPEKLTKRSARKVEISIDPQAGAQHVASRFAVLLLQFGDDEARREASDWLERHPYNVARDLDDQPPSGTRTGRPAG